MADDIGTELKKPILTEDSKTMLTESVTFADELVGLIAKYKIDIKIGIPNFILTNHLVSYLSNLQETMFLIKQYNKFPKPKPDASV